MARIIITTESGISEVEALFYAAQVARAGRCSNSKNGPCYCFATTFTNGIKVYAERTKTGTDTFRVTK